MSTRTTRTALAVAAAAAALGGAAAGVDAATHHDAATPAATFQSRLAQHLGVSKSKLDAATKAAARDTVKRLQASGRIDAKRAKRLDKRIARTGAAPFARFGAAGFPAAHRAALQAEAKALGIDRRALVGELHAGKAPADVIAAHGKDRADVAAAVRDAVRSALAKRLAAAPADQRAQKLADRLTGTTPLRRR